MQFILEWSNWEKNDWQKIGEGSEGEVFSDGKYAYKVVNDDLVPPVEEIIKNHVGKNYQYCVHILDAWADDDQTIIKMELLKQINPNVDDELLSKYHQELWKTEDRVDFLPDLLKKFPHPELQKMTKTYISAAKELNKSTLDVGLHNLMQDPKTNNYKFIDFF
jgi:hypothetical protein